jgi:hypothetical protein
MGRSSLKLVMRPSKLKVQLSLIYPENERVLVDKL